MGKDNETFFDISQKLLAYIYAHEPIDNISELVEKSGLGEETIKLNIERLHDAGLLSGHLVKGLASRYFVHALDLRLSYNGLKELNSLFMPIIAEKGATSILSIHIGKLEFNFNLAKIM